MRVTIGKCPRVLFTPGAGQSLKGGIDRCMIPQTTPEKIPTSASNMPTAASMKHALKRRRSSTPYANGNGRNRYRRSCRSTSRKMERNFVNGKVVEDIRYILLTILNIDNGRENICVNIV